jgi:glycogen(starch) synthase
VRVLAFSDAFWPHVGGIETFLLQLSSYLHARGHEVVVAARYTRHVGASPFPFPVYWRPGDDKLLELVDWCDVLHLNSMDVGMLLRAVRKRKKIVTTNHDVTMICPKGFKIRHDGPCTNRAGPIVCMTCLRRSGTPRPWRMLVRPPMKGLLSLLTHASVVTSPWAMRRYRLFHKRLIPYGTDLACFSPGPAPQLAVESAPARLPRVIFVGRVVYEKGLQVLLEALRRCREVGRPFELMICGEGPYLPEIKAVIEAQDLEPLVNIRGVVKDQALAAALRSAEIAVVPSVWDEAFGIVAIEAMACGVPVIASNTGGLGGVVGELDNELLFERGDSAQLAERLLALLADPARRRTMGEAGRHLVEEKYDLQRMLQAYDELFTTLTHGGR